jgi:hypothetical protein
MHAPSVRLHARSHHAVLLLLLLLLLRVHAVHPRPALQVSWQGMRAPAINIS